MKASNAHDTRWSWTAGVALVLWLLGFDLMPTLHVAFHGAFGEHHHGARRDHDEHPERGAHRHLDHRGDPEDHDGDPETPSEHGKGSLAHFDIAVNVPLPCVPTVREALLTWSEPPPGARDQRPVDARPGTTRARAPPGRSA